MMESKEEEKGANKSKRNRFRGESKHTAMMKMERTNKTSITLCDQVVCMFGLFDLKLPRPG